MAEDDPNKLQQQIEKRDAQLASLKKGQKEMEEAFNQKVDAKDQEIARLEAEKRQLEDQQKKKEGKLAKVERKLEGSGRASRLAVDGLSSAGAQAVNLGEQALLDYLANTFESIGQHRVILKGIPTSLALLWYVVELWTMKDKPTLGKNIRLSLANVLGNLNLVYVGQAFADDWRSHKENNVQIGQANAELQARNELVEKDLERAKKLLADKGIKFESGNGK